MIRIAVEMAKVGITFFCTWDINGLFAIQIHRS